MTESEIVIRDIEDAPEMRAVEEMQREVWGMSERDMVSVFMLKATCAAGGMLAGAFDGERLAGFVYGFIGLEGARPFMHSDMLAVLPEYRGRGLGRLLKLAQRERAIARGLSKVTWTFDPLQARNAYLNFARLGVIATRYCENFYGERSSSFLHATGTDRLWVSWPVASERVRLRVEGAKGASELASVENARPLVRVGSGFEPLREDLKMIREKLENAKEMTEARKGEAETSERESVTIEIPGDIARIEREDLSLAREWRRATRDAFTAALDAGYIVEEFTRRGDGERRKGVYVLTHGERLEDFPDV